MALDREGFFTPSPKIVDDHRIVWAVRAVASRLQADPRLEGFVVEAENFESIHNHSAYARIERDKDVSPA